MGSGVYDGTGGETLLQGKLKPPEKQRTLTPLNLYYDPLTRSHFALINAYLLHGFGLALAQPRWNLNMQRVAREILDLTTHTLGAHVSRSAPFAPNGDEKVAGRAIMTRLLQAYPAALANRASDAQIGQWASDFNGKAALSRELATRYRAVCDDTNGDDTQVWLVRTHSQPQVLVDSALPLEVRKAFSDWPSCQTLAVSNLLAPKPLPALPSAGTTQMLAPTETAAEPKEAPDSAADRDCQTEMRAWRVQSALAVCEEEAQDSLEPANIIRHLWVQLDAGLPAPPIAARVETLLPQWSGADRVAGQVLLAAALTVAGDAARTRTMLTTWLAQAANAEQSDRLALLNGHKPARRWWFSVLVGVYCTPQLNLETRQSWLLRRGWIGTIAEFDKSKARLGPDILRRAAAQARDVNHCAAN